MECDICKNEHETIELFWAEYVDTDKQYFVSEYLTNRGLEACCEKCFYEILKKDNKQ